MDTVSQGDELIDLHVRLPRRTIEQSLVLAQASPDDAAGRRLSEAKVLLTGRRRRAVCFVGVRFCDPSWDMIVELYVATREDRHLAVSQLCSMSGASSTTALRHIEQLEALGYIAREAALDDRRRANVMMLAPLIEAVEQWLDLQMAASQVGC